MLQCTIAGGRTKVANERSFVFVLYFHRTSEVHNYNLRGSNYDFQLPVPKTNFLKRSFSYRGANDWNQLSNQIREIRDLASFKRAIS